MVIRSQEGRCLTHDFNLKDYTDEVIKFVIYKDNGTSVYNEKTQEFDEVEKPTYRINFVSSNPKYEMCLGYGYKDFEKVNNILCDVLSALTNDDHTNKVYMLPNGENDE